MKRDRGGWRETILAAVAMVLIGAAAGIVVGLVQRANAQASAPTGWCGAATCPMQAPPVATGEVWEPVANENGAFTPIGSARVQYGVGERWTEKTMSGGPLSCTNTNFGDPAFGSFKGCRMLTGTYIKPPPPAAPAPAASAVVVTATAPPKPACLPSMILGVPIPGATGSPLQWGAVGEVGDWYGWRCPATVDGVPVVTKWVRKAHKGQALTTLLNEAFRYPNLADALGAMWAKYDSPCESLSATAELMAACVTERDAIVAAAKLGLALPPAPAPVVAWVVVPSGAATSRPAYQFDGYKRSITSLAQAKVGAPCDCSSYIVEGATVYCVIPPASLVTIVPGSHVAACRKK